MNTKQFFPNTLSKHLTSDWKKWNNMELFGFWFWYFVIQFLVKSKGQWGQQKTICENIVKMIKSRSINLRDERQRDKAPFSARNH